MADGEQCDACQQAQQKQQPQLSLVAVCQVLLGHTALGAVINRMGVPGVLGGVIGAIPGGCVPGVYFS